MRILKILGAVIGIVIVLIAVVLVVGIPGGLLAEVIQNRIERQTGYRLEIGTTKIGLRCGLPGPADGSGVLRKSRFASYSSRAMIVSPGGVCAGCVAGSR